MLRNPMLMSSEDQHQHTSFLNLTSPRKGSDRRRRRRRRRPRSIHLAGRNDSPTHRLTDSLARALPLPTNRRKRRRRERRGRRAAERRGGRERGRPDDARVPAGPAERENPPRHRPSRGARAVVPARRDPAARGAVPRAALDDAARRRSTAVHGRARASDHGAAAATALVPDDAAGAGLLEASQQPPEAPRPRSRPPTRSFASS